MEKIRRVVIIGISPLPFENLKKNYAPGKRTWDFALAAKEANCQVIVIGYRIPDTYEKKIPDVYLQKHENIDCYSVIGEIFENPHWLKTKISEFTPDCVVGVTTYPSSIVTNLNLELPFWADLFGSVMAEAQIKSYVFNDDFYLSHFFSMESKILGSADVFSTVSEAQGFSLIGELGIWGRLNKKTMGYRFVRVIPNTAEIKDFHHKKNVIRGKLAKNDDFVILYSGGYNTWTDVDTLFKGLELAMSKNPKLVFVSTGGQITGHDEFTYQHFQDLINSSKFQKRFHLCGWVPQEDLPNYYLESDLAVNSDKYCYEAILGSRTRILDWINASLVFISTPLSEDTRYLISNDLAFEFEPGNSEQLASELVSISNNPEKLTKIKTRLQKILKEEFTSEFTFRDFKKWLKNPTHAPDYQYKISLVRNLNAIERVHSESFFHDLAISSWPKISKLIRIFGLTKYQEQIKKFGFNLVERKNIRIYKAKFLDIEIPYIKINRKYKIPVTIKNIGNVEWQNSKESINGVNLSYLWKDKNDKVVFKDELRTSLPKSVLSGKQIKLDMMLNSPTVPGEYVLQIDMVKENEFWFAEVGSSPFRSVIEIKKNEQ